MCGGGDVCCLSYGIKKKEKQQNYVPEVDDGLLQEGDEDGLGVRELGHELDLDAEHALMTMTVAVVGCGGEGLGGDGGDTHTYTYNINHPPTHI